MTLATTVAGIRSDLGELTHNGPIGNLPNSTTGQLWFSDKHLEPGLVLNNKFYWLFDCDFTIEMLFGTTEDDDSLQITITSPVSATQVVKKADLVSYWPDFATYVNGDNIRASDQDGVYSPGEDGVVQRDIWGPLEGYAYMVTKGEFKGLIKRRSQDSFFGYASSLGGEADYVMWLLLPGVSDTTGHQEWMDSHPSCPYIRPGAAVGLSENEVNQLIDNKELLAVANSLVKQGRLSWDSQNGLVKYSTEPSDANQAKSDLTIPSLGYVKSLIGAVTSGEFIVNKEIQNVDLNTLKSPGQYAVSQSVANSPTVSNDRHFNIVLVFGYGGSNGTQFFIDADFDSASDAPHVFVRAWENNNWTPWADMSPTANKIKHHQLRIPCNTTYWTGSFTTTNDHRLEKLKQLPSNMTLLTAYDEPFLKPLSQGAFEFKAGHLVTVTFHVDDVDFDDANVSTYYGVEINNGGIWERDTIRHHPQLDGHMRRQLTFVTNGGTTEFYIKGEWYNLTNNFVIMTVTDHGIVDRDVHSG
ncbi:hypothetical protein [Vibrio phage BONAISHI]|nr:hypothetical protein [Vibrio phage BONAISHI]